MLTHVLTDEEHEFPIFSLEHSINVIKILKLFPHSVKFDRVTLQQPFVSETPHPDSFENHQLVSNNADGIVVRVTFVRWR